MAFGSRRRVGWRKPGALPIAVLLAAAVVTTRPLPRLFATSGQMADQKGPKIGTIVKGEVAFHTASGKTMINIGAEKFAALDIPLAVSVLERHRQLQKGTKTVLRFDSMSEEGPVVTLVDQEKLLQDWKDQRKPATDFQLGSTVDAKLCFRSRHVVTFDIGCKEVATLIAPTSVKARLKWSDPFTGLRIDGVDAATGQINVTLPDELQATIAARPSLKSRLEPRLLPVRGEKKNNFIIAPTEEQYTEYNDDTVKLNFQNLEIFGMDAKAGRIKVSTKRPSGPDKSESAQDQAPKGRTRFRTATDIFSEGDVVDGVIRTINGFGTWVKLDNQSITEHKDFSLQGISSETKRKLLLGERLRGFKITVLNETVANVEMSPEELAKVEKRTPREPRELSEIKVGDEFYGFVAVIDSKGVWVDFGANKYGKLVGKFKKAVRIGTRLPGVRVARLNLEEKWVHVEVSKPLS